ncbi:hypothetical protein CH289_07835 [Rhodococcus sp. RS1C4]|nr:hypothetical protein [Rhodococcus sp. RS1C4]OZC55092.1 hypothetical protein CH289_07835 [Rhodococcus sp. RS1C4]
MSNPTPTPARRGIGFFGALFLLLLALKLTNLADLSWWWVFTPLIASTGLFILGVIILAVAAVAGKR